MMMILPLILTNLMITYKKLKIIPTVKERRKIAYLSHFPQVGVYDEIGARVGFILSFPIKFKQLQPHS